MKKLTVILTAIISVLWALTSNANYTVIVGIAKEGDALWLNFQPQHPGIQQYFHPSFFDTNKNGFVYRVKSHFLAIDKRTETIHSVIPHIPITVAYLNSYIQFVYAHITIMTSTGRTIKFQVNLLNGVSSLGAQYEQYINRNNLFKLQI